MNRRNLTVNLLLALGALLLVSLAAEGALRFVLLRNLNPFERDPQLEYVLKASFRGLYPRTPVRTDESRRRIPVDAADPAGERLLFVGDSVTFGFGVLAEESYGYRVGEILDDVAGTAIAAVPGYNLQQVIGALRRELATRQPALVVYGLVLNDVYGTPQPLTYEDIDPHAGRVAEGGFLSNSLLIAFIQRRWARIASNFDDAEGPERAPRGTLAELEASLPEGAARAFDEQWQELEQLQLDSDVPVVVLVCPYRQQVAGGTETAPLSGLQDFVLTRCENSPLTCLDPLALFQSRPAEELFNEGSTFHYSVRGHELLAEWLVRELRLAGIGGRD